MALKVTNAVSPSQFIDSIDVNDPEYIRQLLRPPAIKEDLNLMQQRSRVSLILRSPYFRKELEKIVASQMKDGYLSTNIYALKQLLDYLTPHTKLGSSNFTRGATMPVLPINDLKGAHPANYLRGERLVRCKVASLCRLVHIFGWNKGINCHVTARVTRDSNEFLINPLGLLYQEVTASSLAKVDLKGSILDPGTAGLGIDRQGWMLHAAVHEARPDVRCIIHLNTPATVAVSCTKSGLLPVSQEAMILGECCTYDPSVLVSNASHGDSEEDAATRRERRHAEERAAIADILNGQSQECVVLMIRNHGLLAMGQSIEEAWFTAFTAVVACETQLRLAGISENELILPAKEAQQVAHHAGRTPAAAQLRPGESAGSSGWRLGELEFEALMRRLDAAGYHTGHVYRLGQLHTTSGAVRRPPEDVVNGAPSTEPMTPREAAAYVRKSASLGKGLRGIKDVEVPPAASSFASTYYGDDESRAAAAAEARAKTMSLSSTHWLNTPNTYARKDIPEVGTPNPKMIAHWTEDIEDNAKRRTGGVAVPIDNPNQFAPQGRDPHEFKRKQRRLKEKYYKDVKNAGPKSRILEGITLDDEANGLSDEATSPVVSPRGTLLRLDPYNPPAVEPGHVVVVGAASKGIINRDQRHNVGVYQSVYSPNPFDHVTDEDLERYRENMDRKAKGLPSLEDEETALRIEQAREAAEVARKAMEAAASQPQKHKFRLRASFGAGDRDTTFGAMGAPDQSNTLADLPSSLLCSSNTSACLNETDQGNFSHMSSQYTLDKDLNSDGAHVKFSSVSMNTLPSNLVAPTSKKPLIRRHSAFRFWNQPRLHPQFVSAAITDTSEYSADSWKYFSTHTLATRILKRHKTMHGLTDLFHVHRPAPMRGSRPSVSQAFGPSGGTGHSDKDEHSDHSPPTLSVSPELSRGLHAGRSPPSCKNTSNSRQTELTDVDTSRAGQSYTSGAEASHDDTEKETHKGELDGTETKKKRRFKMPSFARKSKPKKAQ